MIRIDYKILLFSWYQPLCVDWSLMGQLLTLLDQNYGVVLAKEKI